MNLKVHEVLGSALAAVTAAAAASVFGVKGTLVGAAVGATVATSVASLVSQSTARPQLAIKRSVSTGTGVTGQQHPSPSTDVRGSVEASAVLVAPAGIAVSYSPPRTGRASAPTHVRHRHQEGRWRPPMVATVSAVTAFVLALCLVTLVELGAGRSLSSLFGGPKSATTVGGVINGVSPSVFPTTSPAPTPTTAPPATTSSTTVGTTTTTSETTSSTSSTPSSTTTPTP